MKENKKKDSESDEAQRSLQRGNINFDILEPEHPRGFSKEKTSLQPHIRVERKSKRGIFDLQVKQNPVNAWQIILWIIVLVSCLVILGYIIFFAYSLLWMLFLPLFLIGLFWSIIMLVLFKARPR